MGRQTLYVMVIYIALCIFPIQIINKYLNFTEVAMNAVIQ